MHPRNKPALRRAGKHGTLKISPGDKRRVGQISPNVATVCIHIHPGGRSFCNGLRGRIGNGFAWGYQQVAQCAGCCNNGTSRCGPITQFVIQNVINACQVAQSGAAIRVKLTVERAGFQSCKVKYQKSSPPCCCVVANGPDQRMVCEPVRLVRQDKSGVAMRVFAQRHELFVSDRFQTHAFF